MVGPLTLGGTPCGVYQLVAHSEQTPDILYSRFCQLKYFFKSAKGEPMFHGQWYLHGSRTLLNELSHSQALYPVNVCDDQPLDSIYQKAHVTFLSKDDPEPQDDGSPETNNFHCR